MTRGAFLDTRTPTQREIDAARWNRTRLVPHPAPPCPCKIEGERCSCAISPIFGTYGGRVK